MKFSTLNTRAGEKGEIEISVAIPPSVVHGLLAELYETIASCKHLERTAEWSEIEKAAETSFPPGSFAELRRDFVVNHVVSEVCKRLAVSPALTPQIHAVDYPVDGEAYEFSLSIVERPRLTLSSYDPVSVSFDEREVTPEVVQAKADELLDGFAEYEQIDPRAVKRGDYVLCDVITQRNGAIDAALSATRRTMHVDESDMPKGLASGFVGMEPGETKVVKYALPRKRGLSPNDLDRFVATVTVHCIQRKIPIDLDDEFVRAHFPKVSTVEEFYDELKGDLEYDARAANRDTIAHLANNEIEKRLIGEIPDRFYQASFKAQRERLASDLKKQGKSFDDYYEENQMNEEESSVQMLIKSGENLRQGFALEALFDGRGMTLTQEDLARACKQLFSSDDVDVNELEKTGRLRVVQDAAKRMRALTWLVDTAKVNEGK